MNDTARIQCITKDNGGNPYERITHVGGINPDGSRWRITQLEATDGIRIGRYQFWVKLDGHSLWVVAAKSATGFTFLKAETDGDEPNGLLRLPECP